MKLFYILALLWWLLISTITLGQNAQIDSLKRILTHRYQDTIRVKVLTDLSYAYVVYSPSMSMQFARQALTLAQKNYFPKGEAQAFSAVGYCQFMQGDFPQALGNELKALKLARDLKLGNEEALILSNIGSLYFQLGEPKKALVYFPQAKKAYEAVSDRLGVARIWTNMTRDYLGLNQLDSAWYANRQAYQLIRQQPGRSMSAQQFSLAVVKAGILRNFGQLEALAGNHRDALTYYHQALLTTDLDNNVRTRAQIQILMAQLFNELHRRDSSLHYARQALLNSRQAIKSITPTAANLLAKLYKEQGKLDSVVYYLEIAQASNDSLFGPKKFQQLQILSLAEQQRQQELVSDQQAYANKVRFYTLLASLTGVLLIAFIQYRNNRQKHKANELLHQKNNEIQRALTELRTTQTQLIQREKMASLGELTAGIAHEIQNPLNFVNNFAELSAELVEELKDEIRKGETQEAQAITDDLTQNLQKITHHGNRASSIVKGMLEHSRTSSGRKEPTDFNILCKEYLRLAYQGFRSKDNQFNCELLTTFDPNLPNVEIAAQEIGRVLLNLYNNAFYAVGQKQKTALSNYQPTVWISTAQVNGYAEIRVKDNGIGIPESVKAKIFQPFFTTKPTGEGTGLGLSLSYDLVTKGHGGSLDVKTVSGEFTEFIIVLPIAQPEQLMA